jgi:GntR family transcriptional regulator
VRTVDHTSRLPLYAQLSEIIAAQLASGELKPGDALPTEAELCAFYGVSRTVVRQAIGDFVARGRLYRRRGKGTFVASFGMDERFVRPTLGFFDDLAAAGVQVSNDLVGIEAVAADAALAHHLDVQPGDRCVRIERVRRVDGEPTALMRSFLPESLHPQLMEQLAGRDFRHTSLPRLLETAVGVRPHSGHRWIQAVVADADVAARLGGRTGDAVLYVESIEDDAAGRRIEYSQAWHRGDRTRLELASSAAS